MAADADTGARLMTVAVQDCADLIGEMTDACRIPEEQAGALRVVTAIQVVAALAAYHRMSVFEVMALVRKELPGTHAAVRHDIEREEIALG